MEIKTTFLIKDKSKLLAKKKQYNVNIKDDDILYYFEHIATPYDLIYTCSHLKDNELIKTWINKIALYNTNIYDIKYGEILDFNISENAINIAKDIIIKLANKRGIMVSHKH